MPRNTRRTAAQLEDSKENLESPALSQRENVTSKKGRHRLSTTELARLEDVFKQETHPSRQKKKELAAQLGMDYKTITIWFQNKRQTSKRGQPPSAEKSDLNWRRTRADSCLRAVSSPSHNATLGASEAVPTASAPQTKADSIASRAIVKIKPLLDSLNGLASKSRGYPESTEAQDGASRVEDIGPRLSHTTPSENAAVSAEQEQTKGNVRKTARWKRLRTLEWACERQAKRRQLSREGYVRLGSEEAQDGDTSDARVDSALSLLSLASSAAGPPKDVVRGAALLISFKHSWRGR